MQRPNIDAQTDPSPWPRPLPVYSCADCPGLALVGEAAYDMHTLLRPRHRVARADLRVGGPGGP